MGSGLVAENGFTESVKPAAFSITIRSELHLLTPDLRENEKIKLLILLLSLTAMWRPRPAPTNRRKQQISPGRSQTHRAKAEAICSLFTWYSAYSWPLIPATGDGLFLTVYTPSEFVETLFASWRLPP